MRLVSRCLLKALFFSSLLNRYSVATVVLNSISASFADLPAKFDGTIPSNGICGPLYVADPLHGCSPLLHNTSNWTVERNKLALIIRGECSFDDKLLNAHKSGFKAVIVYNNLDNDENLVVMKVNPKHIRVYAVFVSNVDGETLRKYARGRRDDECCLYPPSNARAWTVLAISFFSLLLVAALLLLGFFAPRQWRGRQDKRTMKLDSKLVNALPSFTFTDSDHHHKAGETCAICLEDYKFGESLRLLPCQHAFHLKCIDSWLTKWGVSCPVCKHDIRTTEAMMSSEVHKRDASSTSRLNFSQSIESR